MHENPVNPEGQPPRHGAHPVCDECGAFMEECYCMHEQGVVFVWHECSRPDCQGMLLLKAPAVPHHAPGRPPGGGHPPPAGP